MESLLLILNNMPRNYEHHLGELKERVLRSNITHKELDTLLNTLRLITYTLEDLKTHNELIKKIDNAMNNYNGDQCSDGWYKLVDAIETLKKETT